MTLALGAWKLVIGPRWVAGLVALIWGLGLLSTPVWIMLTAMCADAPGSGNNPPYRRLAGALTCWPISAILGLVISLVGFYLSDMRVSLVGLCVPIPHFLFMFFSFASLPMFEKRSG